MRRLHKGDTIAILNPSFNNGDNVLIEKEKLEKLLEKRGYKTRFYPSFYDKYGYLAGTDEQRSKDINDAFSDERIKAIICMRGGYGASRIVDKIDYDIVRSNHKIFSGYSDITVLINSFYKMSDLISFHGLVGVSLLGNNFASIDAFFDMLEAPLKDKVLKSPDGQAKCLVGGKVCGKVVGGNLTLLSTLTGTPYQVDLEDKIVLIEDVKESPYRIDRYLSTLRLSGELKKAKGFILGYFTDCTSSSNQKVEDIINEYILPLNKPTISNFATGHSFPFVTIPIGAKVELDADNLTIKILEEIYDED